MLQAALEQVEQHGWILKREVGKKKKKKTTRGEMKYITQYYITYMFCKNRYTLSMI